MLVEEGIVPGSFRKSVRVSDTQTRGDVGSTVAPVIAKGKNGRQESRNILRRV